MKTCGRKHFFFFKPILVMPLFLPPLCRSAWRSCLEDIFSQCMNHSFKSAMMLFGVETKSIIFFEQTVFFFFIICSCNFSIFHTSGFVPVCVTKVHSAFRSGSSLGSFFTLSHFPFSLSYHFDSCSQYTYSQQEKCQYLWVKAHKLNARNVSDCCVVVSGRCFHKYTQWMEKLWV